MTAPGVTVFVCVSCRDGEDADARPGALLLEALRARLSERGLDIAVEPVDCLAVCKRPATVAFAGAGKWTYVIGDLAGATDIDDLIDSAQSFAATDNGVVAWKDRPDCFKKGVVSRVPPVS
jgi:predicted metal-binding protein